ncbi:MAG: VOC family protein, partial [Acidimicrobiales bacterium]
MPDPLDALRLPIVPVNPRPEFADTLLARMTEGDKPAGTDPVATPTVRYFVDDIEVAIEFYCRLLDFEEELRPSPSFAMLYRGDLRLLLSVPGTAHALPDGTLPEPGGWNRMALQVTDLTGAAESLRQSGVRMRTDIVTSVGVRQILV